MGFSGPLYDQVHKHLRARILAGEWEHWQPLPPEVMLSQELGVSVGTVRKAMEKLMQEKIVVRERGRGTFVRRETSQRPIPTLSIHDHDGSTLEAEKSLTRFSATHLSGSAARLLAPKLGSGATLPVLTFERDWRVGPQLVCHETIAVNRRILQSAADVGDQPGDELLAKYLDQFRMQAQSVRWEIGSQSLLASEGTFDELRAPTVTATRFALDADGDPFEACEHVVSLASHTFEIVQ